MILEQALETLQAPEHERQKQQVITAVKKLNLKVTPDEVAQESGLPLLKVNQLLNTVAYETQAHLAVDTAGSIEYKFEPNFESHYLIDGSRNCFAWLWRVTYNAFKIALKTFILVSFFLIRVTFGIVLVASVVLVVVLIIAAIVAAIASLFSGSDSGGGDSSLDLGGGDSGDVSWLGSIDWGGGLRYWSFDWCWDWWHWHHYYDDGCWQSHYIAPSYTATSSLDVPVDYSTYPNGEVPQERKKEKTTNFLDNCFAVLFGIGNPNQNWDVERWRVVAQAIRSKSGVVLAEDLAPYMEQRGRDEDWMLPVLVRFNGMPEVSDSGKLIYVFPSFIPERTTPAVQTIDNNDLNNIYANFLSRQKAHKTAEINTVSLPQFIQKREIPLCGLDGGDATTVLFVASVAFGGAIYLLGGAGGLHVPFMHALRPVLMAVAAYGGLFFLLPACRLPFVMSDNTKIAAENEERVAAAQRLAHPDSQLHQWQHESAMLREAVLSGNDRTQVYTTEQDALEQEFSNAQPERVTSVPPSMIPRYPLNDSAASST